MSAAIVDHQSHWTPPAALELLVGRERFPRARRQDGGHVLELAPRMALPLGRPHVDLDAQLAEADANGVAALLSSPNLLGEVLDHPAAEAAELLQAVNTFVAGAQREHAGRFAGLALLPLQDAGAAIAVLDDAHAQGLRGVCVLPTIAGAPIGGEATLPVFQRIAALGLPVFLHPEFRTPTHLSAASPRAEVGIGWMADTSRAALSLVDGGVLDACPDLVVVHPHLGGVLPWLHGRVGRIFPPEGRPPLAEVLRTRFYTDCVSATPGALRFALEVYGPERVLYASDYPYVPMGAVRGYVASESAPEIYANRVPGLPLG